MSLHLRWAKQQIDKGIKGTSEPCLKWTLLPLSHLASGVEVFLGLISLVAPGARGITRLQVERSPLK